MEYAVVLHFGLQENSFLPYKMVACVVGWYGIFFAMVCLFGFGDVLRKGNFVLCWFDGGWHLYYILSKKYTIFFGIACGSVDSSFLWSGFLALWDSRKMVSCFVQGHYVTRNRFYKQSNVVVERYFVLWHIAFGTSVFGTFWGKTIVVLSCGNTKTRENMPVRRIFGYRQWIADKKRKTCDCRQNCLVVWVCFPGNVLYSY